MEMSDAYTKAATLYVAREPDEVCRRDGCDRAAIVAFTFLGDHGDEVVESYVFLCRTHMHGFLGHFLDYGEAVEGDD